jgi:YD repeat-containing protein
VLLAGIVLWRRYGVFLLSLTVALALSVGQLQAQQPGAIQYFYDDLGRLIMVIDADGNAAEYVYDAVGNILEIKRLTFSGLAILNFTPSQGPVGTRVTLQGQGFSATPSENTVSFNGTGAAVLSATQTSLVVTVPPGATTGPIAVTVAGNTATSDRRFSVLPTPEITSVMPSVALAGSVLPNLRVQGRHLEGATLTFVSAKPLVTVTAVTIDPTGTSATLNITVRANTSGTAVVHATSKAFVSSDATPSAANTLRILNGSADEDGDGLSNSDEFARGAYPLNPDTDGDGVGDGDEVVLGSNPLDSHDHPVTQAQSAPVAYLNTFVADTDGDGFADRDEVAFGTDPTNPQARPASQAQSTPVAYLNTFVADTDGDGFTDVDEVLVGTDPTNPQARPAAQAQSVSVAYLNTLVADTDGDGFADRDEVAFGTAPTDPASQPTTIASSAVVSYQNDFP